MYLALRMRILHLSSLYPPHIVGGAERSVELIAETQASLGHVVAAACIEREAEPKVDRHGVQVYRMPHENEFWLEDWPKHSKPARIWQKVKQQWNFAIEKRFGEVIDDFQPDIVHTHSLVDISPLVWRAASQRKLPIVHTLRDYALTCANAAMFRRGANCERLHIKCTAMTGVSRLLQGSVGSVVGVGAEILDRHVEMGYFHHVPKDRRQVIWNPAVVKGAGPGYRRPERTTDDLVIGYLGRINIEKGVGTLLRACGKLPKTGWRLRVAGEAVAGLDEFQTLAGDMPIDFLGFVPPKEFFDSIDVLVVPSIWPEPLPRTILESYAMGVPALGSRSGGIPDLIGHHNDAWLFEPDNAEMLASRLSALIAAPRESLPGTEDFRHVLEQTTPAIVAEKYQQLYEQTIAANVNGSSNL